MAEALRALLRRPGQERPMSRRLQIPQITAAPSAWTALRAEAAAAAAGEPTLASLVHLVILEQRTFEDALSCQLARKLGGFELSAMVLRDTIKAAHHESPRIP